MPRISYSDEIADRICARLIEGESMRSICSAEGMPDRQTVVNWLASGEYKEFATKYALAREAQADYMDDLILDIAKGCTVETANADRVKLDALKWRAARLAPKRYADRQVYDHKLSATEEPEITDEKRVRALQVLMARMALTNGEGPIRLAHAMGTADDNWQREADEQQKPDPTTDWMNGG